MLKTWTINEMEKDMVEPHGEESRIEWLISCVRWKETAAHPMSWLAVTFTTQEINSLIPWASRPRSPCGSPFHYLFHLWPRPEALGFLPYERL